MKNLSDNRLIEDCATIADKFAADERVQAKSFGEMAKTSKDVQYRIAEATHILMSILASRIADDIRKLKNE